MVFKGAVVAQGTGRRIVAATGMKTEMGAIAAMLKAPRRTSPPISASSNPAPLRCRCCCRFWW